MASRAAFKFKRLKVRPVLTTLSSSSSPSFDVDARGAHQRHDSGPGSPGMVPLGVEGLMDQDRWPPDTTAAAIDVPAMFW